VPRDSANTDWLAVARALLVDPSAPEPRAWLAGAPALPEAPWPPAPDGLVALPSAEAPAAWHARGLAATAATGSPLAVAWHARWLAYALAPQDAASLPRVSVVIPVYNRADKVIEAVESALAQDWPATEVVVVDDASTDGTLGALERFGDRIVLQRQARNGGVAVARNAGLARASGELVHFLDSDNLLLPGAIGRKVAALAHVPDALLCFSSQELLRRGEARSVVLDWPEIGSPICPTRLPAVGLIVDYPFFISTLLAARHLVLAAGGFDERLRRHEDRLLFHRMGLLEPRTVALRQPLSLVRRVEASLGTEPDLEGQGALGSLLFLCELLEQPQRWEFATFVFNECFGTRQWAALNAGSDTPEGPSAASRAALASAAQRLFAWLDDFAAGRRFPEYSPRPLAAELRARLADRGVLGQEGRFATPLAAVLERLQASRAPGPADLALWRRGHNPLVNRPAFDEIFAALSQALREGRGWLPLAELDDRPLRSLPHPRRGRWKRIARTARLFGERPARALARWQG